MHALEIRNSSNVLSDLPQAWISKPGHDPVLQIYSQQQLPLRRIQKLHGGRIFKLTLRPSSPFHLRIGHRLVVTSDSRTLPTKERSIPRLKIRAGPAFGTGEHATTHLCLRYLTRFLAQTPRKNCAVLDLGCGSGILALAGARLGSKAEGWDNDESAVREADRNARLNRLTSRAHFRQADALRSALPPADLILANLYDSLLLHLLPRLEKHRRSGSTVILSGILRGQENAVLRTARKLGWKLQRRGRQGRWFCFQLVASERKKSP
jgi:ribosomal protein L11 methyltransferase